jgi:hypothetical protein
MLYVLGEHASRDRDVIWEYLAEDNVEAADEWIARLFDGFEAVSIYFLFLARSSNRAVRRSAASAHLCFSSSVSTINGRTAFGDFVVSSIATNVTNADVVCFCSPVSTFSE